MKRLLIVIVITIISTFAAFAQNGRDDQEIMKIHKPLDQAYMNKDAAAFERIMADDYTYSSPSGKMSNRAHALEDMRKEFADVKYKVLSATTDDVKVKVAGNMAFVNGNWTWTATPANAAANAEPHEDTGRFTNIYEKRNGKWMLVAEHWSEAHHDREMMKQQVAKMGQEYTRMIKNADVAALEMLLADEYQYTDNVGKVKNKTEDLASYKTPAKFEIFEVSDQKVNVIGNNSAVETGTVRFKGTDKDDKPFDRSERYTTTW